MWNSAWAPAPPLPAAPPPTTATAVVAVPQAPVDGTSGYPQYTAAQFAAMTPDQQLALQQHWQQWQKYQEEYAKWHAQYGEQYNREMAAAMSGPASVAVAPAVASYATFYQQQPPLPPPDNTHPPPPQVPANQSGKIAGQPQMYSQVTPAPAMTNPLFNQPPPPPVTSTVAQQPQIPPHMTQPPPLHLTQMVQNPPPMHQPPPSSQQLPPPPQQMSMTAPPLQQQSVATHHLQQPPMLQQPPPIHQLPPVQQPPHLQQQPPPLSQHQQQPPMHQQPPPIQHQQPPPIQHHQLPPQQQQQQSRPFTNFNQPPPNFNNPQSRNQYEMNSNDKPPFNDNKNSNSNSNFGNEGFNRGNFPPNFNQQPNDQMNRQNQFRQDNQWNNFSGPPPGDNRWNRGQNNEPNFMDSNNRGNQGPPPNFNNNDLNQGPGNNDQNRMNNNRFGSSGERNSFDNRDRSERSSGGPNQWRGNDNFQSIGSNNRWNNNDNSSNNFGPNSNRNEPPYRNENNLSNSSGNFGNSGSLHQSGQQNQRPDLDEESFDRQFRQWEQQFEDWKKANANHPDRGMYERYEMEFERQRRRIMERREQMRRRKMEKMGMQESTANFTQNQSSNQTQSQNLNPPVEEGHSLNQENKDVEGVETEIVAKDPKDEVEKEKVKDEVETKTISGREEKVESENILHSQEGNPKTGVDKETKSNVQKSVDGSKRKSRFSAPEEVKVDKPAGTAEVISLDDDEDEDADEPTVVEEQPAGSMSVLFSKSDDIPGLDLVDEKASNTSNVEDTESPPKKMKLSDEGAKSTAKKIPSLFDVVIKNPNDPSARDIFEERRNTDGNPMSAGENALPANLPDIANTLKDPEFLKKISDALAKAQGKDKPSSPGGQFANSNLSFAEWQRTKSSGRTSVDASGQNADMSSDKDKSEDGRSRSRFSNDDHDREGGNNGDHSHSVINKRFGDNDNLQSNSNFGPGNGPNFGDQRNFNGPDGGNMGPNGSFNNPNNRFGPNIGGPNRFGGNNGPDFGGPPNNRFGPDNQNFGGFGGGNNRFGPNFGGPNEPNNRFGPNNGPNFRGPNEPNNRFGPNGPNFGGPNDMNRFGPNGGPNFGPNNRFGPGGPGDNFYGPNNRFGPNNGPNFGGPNEMNNRFGPNCGPNNNNNRFGNNDRGNFGGRPNDRSNFGNPNNGRFGNRGGPNDNRFGPDGGRNFGGPDDSDLDRFDRQNRQNFGGPNRNNFDPNKSNNGRNNRNFNDNPKQRDYDEGQKQDQSRGGEDGNRDTDDSNDKGSQGNMRNANNPFRRSGGPEVPLFDEPDRSNSSWLNGPAPNARQDNFYRPAHVIDYQNTSMAPKVFDYGHQKGSSSMASQLPSVADVEFKPVKTFEYGHTSSSNLNVNLQNEAPFNQSNLNERNRKRNRHRKRKNNKNATNTATDVGKSQQSTADLEKQDQTISQDKKNVVVDAADQQKNEIKENDINSNATKDLEEISDTEDNLQDVPCDESENDSLVAPPPPVFSLNAPHMLNFRNSGAMGGSIFPSTASANQNITKSSASHLQMSIPTIENHNTIAVDEVLLNPGRITRPKKICIVIRGPPGSGKSHIARLIKEKENELGGANPRILSIDDYFLIENDYIEKCPKTGKSLPKKEILYEYEKEMEETYMQYLIKQFKKTIADNLYDFVIVDCNNNSLRTLNEFYCHSKDSGFMPYIVDLHCDLETCLSRNIHDRTEEDIKAVLDTWNATPLHYIKLDCSSLLENLVEMEDADDMVTEKALDQQETVAGDNVNESQDAADADAGKDAEENSNEAADDDAVNCGFLKSKWENDTTSENLARLDGTNKLMNKRKTATMEDFLQMDDWEPPKTSTNGKKRVRWADIEEKRAQEKMRAIGFVVGQTDWKRMMDPHAGNRALNRTKYIERVKKRR